MKVRFKGIDTGMRVPDDPQSMTPTERRAWLLRPIVVNQYGGKGWAGSLTSHREYTTLWKRSVGTEDNDNFNSAPIDQY